MKKIILIILFFIPTIMFSQQKKISRWSLAPEFGYNHFDGDINQDLVNVIPTSFRDITYGGTIEYAFTPIWGISLDGYYFPLRAKNNSPTSMYINTNLITSDLNATINFTRLIFPNTRSKFFVLGTLGFGFAYYTFDLRYLDGTVIPAGASYIDQKYNGQERPIHLIKNAAVMTYGTAISVPVTFAFEYNFSKPLALGLKIHYRAYAKDNLEGATYLNWDGVTNDYIGAGTAYLRFKFNSLKRDHLRNLRMKDYEPDEALQLIADVKKDLAGVKAKVDTLQNTVGKLIPRIDKLENLINNVGPDSDNDGVIDMRDLDPNTPANTVVDFYGRTLPMQNQKTNDPKTTQKKYYSEDDDIPAVYFDFDRTELDNDALVTISKVARHMKKDSTLLVEVRGYCDNLGDITYNERLSTRRSQRVKNELVRIWGISENRIIVNGKGKITIPTIKYRPNRRCDFFYGNDIPDILNN
ncbi:MAG: hypothetical protein AUK44_04230 [Porphyromonadaceae bacterium CG2_30_38_12]|nr:MAG: hypothetical protein AUK44_04230 [Porphyromonadaceae bacterium CG2_30_38_12]